MKVRQLKIELSVKKKIIINKEEHVTSGIIILNIKVTVTEIKHYQLKNVLIKLEQI